MIIALTGPSWSSAAPCLSDPRTSSLCYGRMVVDRMDKID